MTRTLAELKSFYLEHTFDNLLEFWLRDGIDRENGAFFTCFNNAGDRLVSRNKYTWSQGRFLWMLAHAAWAFRDALGPRRYGRAMEAAASGARFLREHALLPNGNCAWVLDEKGAPILTDRKGNRAPPGPGARLDLGIAADQFLVYGMAEYARAADDREYYQFALRLFDSVQRRLETGDFLSFPHNTPNGLKSHGRSMIMVETAQELADVAIHFRDPAAFRLSEVARRAMATTLSLFVRREEKTLLEQIHEDGSPAWEELLGATINPGHSLEDAWFIMHYARRIADREALLAGTEITRWMTTTGWDTEHGGLPQFVHWQGGPPRGEVPPHREKEHMVREVQGDWANKLWWVHSEALYALILSYEVTREKWFLDTYRKFHEYVFSTFPNPNREVGEWIQIRDRQGRPEDKVVALPVKDPYHITRAFMHLIQALERMIGEGRVE
jgi:N-acylglucosamine 2-epimerase